MLCVFGNEHVPGDGFALAVARELNVEYRHIRNPDELLWLEGAVTILDVVSGLSEPRRITIPELRTRSVLTAHDFDVGFFLTLMEKLDLGDVRIIGIPQAGDTRGTASEVERLLEEQT